MKELDKTYNPSEIEGRIYDKWMEKKYFHAEVNRDSFIWVMHWIIPCRIF